MDDQPIDSSAGPLALNRWTHLAVTFSGRWLRFYVDGQPAGARTIGSGHIEPSTGALRIGGNTVWGEWFQGTIDDVRVYDVARSQAQIQADMNTPVGN